MSPTLQNHQPREVYRLTENRENRRPTTKALLWDCEQIGELKAVW